jgi:hypothetical protein
MEFGVVLSYLSIIGSTKESIGKFDGSNGFTYNLNNNSALSHKVDGTEQLRKLGKYY